VNVPATTLLVITIGNCVLPTVAPGISALTVNYSPIHRASFTPFALKSKIQEPLIGI
jgi:hypothetical protein